MCGGLGVGMKMTPGHFVCGGGFLPGGIVSRGVTVVLELVEDFGE